MREIPEAPRVFRNGDETWEAQVLDQGSIARLRLRPTAGGADVELSGGVRGPNADGSLLIVLDRSQGPPVVRVHRLAGGVVVGVPLARQNGCDAAAASSDGKRAATSEGRLLRLWDLGSGRDVRPAIRKGAPITAMAYSPDGNLLLVGDDSGEVRLHDAGDGMPVAVHRVAFDPDGRAFDAGSDGAPDRPRATRRRSSGAPPP